MKYKFNETFKEVTLNPLSKSKMISKSVKSHLNDEEMSKLIVDVNFITNFIDSLSIKNQDFNAEGINAKLEKDILPKYTEYNKEKIRKKLLKEKERLAWSNQFKKFKKTLSPFMQYRQIRKEKSILGIGSINLKNANGSNVVNVTNLLQEIDNNKLLRHNKTNTTKPINSFLKKKPQGGLQASTQSIFVDFKNFNTTKNINLYKNTNKIISPNNKQLKPINSNNQVTYNTDNQNNTNSQINQNNQNNHNIKSSRNNNKIELIKSDTDNSLNNDINTNINTNINFNKKINTNITTKNQDKANKTNLSTSKLSIHSKSNKINRNIISCNLLPNLTKHNIFNSVKQSNLNNTDSSIDSKEQDNSLVINLKNKSTKINSNSNNYSKFNKFQRSTSNSTTVLNKLNLQNKEFLSKIEESLKKNKKTSFELTKSFNNIIPVDVIENYRHDALQQNKIRNKYKETKEKEFYNNNNQYNQNNIQNNENNDNNLNTERSNTNFKKSHRKHLSHLQLNDIEQHQPRIYDSYQKISSFSQKIHKKINRRMSPKSELDKSYEDIEYLNHYYKFYNNFRLCGISHNVTHNHLKKVYNLNPDKYPTMKIIKDQQAKEYQKLSKTGYVATGFNKSNSVSTKHLDKKLYNFNKVNNPNNLNNTNNINSNNLNNSHNFDKTNNLNNSLNLSNTNYDTKKKFHNLNISNVNSTFSFAGNPLKSLNTSNSWVSKNMRKSGFDAMLTRNELLKTKSVLDFNQTQFNKSFVKLIDDNMKKTSNLFKKGFNKTKRSSNKIETMDEKHKFGFDYDLYRDARKIAMQELGSKSEFIYGENKGHMVKNDANLDNATMRGLSKLSNNVNNEL